MGFYIKKRIKLGPVNINLSKSGIGYSIGVKGARISTGPKGTHVNIGRNGLYYREKLSTKSKKATTPPSNNSKLTTETIIKHDKDLSSDKIIKEIREKHKLIEYAKVSNWIFGIICFFLLMNRSEILIGIIPLSILSYFAFSKRDRIRKGVYIVYEKSQLHVQNYKKLVKAFDVLQKSDKLWYIESSQISNNYKYQSGADELVNKKDLILEQEHPKFVGSNITPYKFEIEKKTLYFFPDRILVFSKDNVLFISYKNFEVYFSECPFIESEDVPEDSKIIGHVWKYPNKDGSPDRRFSNNYQIPKVLYSQITLSNNSTNIEIISSSYEKGKMFTELARTFFKSKVLF